MVAIAHNYEGFVSWDDFLSIPCDTETWLIKPLVPTAGFVNVYGQPKKARKSYFAIGMAWAVSTGQPSWLGFDVHKHGPVLYLQVDTPHTLWRPRMVDIASGGYDFSNVFQATIKTVPYPFNIEQHEDLLAEYVSAVPDAVLVIFDTAAAMHIMDENSIQQMGMFMQALNRVAGDRAKVLVSHDSKSGGQYAASAVDAKQVNHESEGGSLMKGNRGASNVAGAMDTVIKLTPKGYMYYQGRAVGEEHRKLRFDHVHKQGACPHIRLADCMGYMWNEEISPEVEEAQKLIRIYKQGSERSLGRMLAKTMGWADGEERARAVIRRQKEKG